MIGLWDTTGAAVVRALADERRTAGGVTSGLALSLIAVVQEAQVRVAEAAATIAAASRPCRLLIVMRTEGNDRRSRLDAEIVVGGRLGQCEAVIMRMLGELSQHAESVVRPLLAPDMPVVTWWQGPPPDLIRADPLGAVADRRITDCARAERPMAALLARAADYVDGDTDLTWTRLTPWRTLLASVFDGCQGQPRAVEITAGGDDPSAALLRGWLTTRLKVPATIRSAGAGAGAGGERISAVRITLSDGAFVELDRRDSRAVLRRPGHPDRTLPLTQRPVGEELAEELRRLDADQPYGAALRAAAEHVASADPAPSDPARGDG